MIGPTVAAKTEIARRLARLAKAPFVKWNHQVHRSSYLAAGGLLINDWLMWR